MKYFLLIILITGFTSCTSYRYLKLDSADLYKNKDNGFTEENDSLQVNYNFYGNKGPLHLTIYNRKDEPLQIDLSRSALIVNDKAISLYSGDIQLNGAFRGSSVQWTRSVSTSQGSLVAKGSVPQSILFIPAHAYIDITPISLTDQFFDTIPDTKFVKSLYTNDNGLTLHEIKTASFDQSASPLVFRTYLTFMTPEAEHKEFVQEHIFYIAEVVKAPFRPQNFGYVQSPNGDKFYVSRTKGSGIGAGLLVATAVAASGAAHANGGK
jgi:hypothetical protein